MKDLLAKIREYQQVVIYRHINPDYDAFGSQVGMYYLLKDQFKTIHFVLAGQRKSDICPLFFDFTVDDLIDCHKKTLGLVVDTANRERIDGDYSMCEELIKIDHHIVVDKYGVIQIVDEKASSCSQIITDIVAKTAGLELNPKAARVLFMGIVGDSNRFLYRNTDARTFRLTADLLDTGIDIEEIYHQMYLKDRNELRVTQFILNHYHEEGGVAYYILNDDDLKQLGISREEGSNYVNTLSDVKQFEIWLAITENKEMNNYRVSIRSRSIAINEVANQFNGGGHALASGATLHSLDELDELINVLKEKVNGYNI